jgi:hypothetical protein
MWVAVWLLGVMVSGLCSCFAWSTLRDANEEGLPLENRPSWKIFGPRESPSATLRQHRRRYPERRTIRLCAVVALFLQGAVLVVPLVWWRFSR